MPTKGKHNQSSRCDGGSSTIIVPPLPPPSKSPATSRQLRLPLPTSSAALSLSSTIEDGGRSSSHHRSTLSTHTHQQHAISSTANVLRAVEPLLATVPLPVTELSASEQHQRPKKRGRKNDDTIDNHGIGNQGNFYTHVGGRGNQIGATISSNYQPHSAPQSQPNGNESNSITRTQNVAGTMQLQKVRIISMSNVLEVQYLHSNKKKGFPKDAATILNKATARVEKTKQFHFENIARLENTVNALEDNATKQKFIALMEKDRELLTKWSIETDLSGEAALAEKRRHKIWDEVFQIERQAKATAEAAKKEQRQAKAAAEATKKEEQRQAKATATAKAEAVIISLVIIRMVQLTFKLV